MSKFWNWLQRKLGVHDLLLKVIESRRQIDVLRNREYLLEEKYTTLEKTLNLGVDIAIRDHDSWAVICVQGRTDYVKFLKLPSNDIREIQLFLRKFQMANQIVDAPPFARHLLKKHR